MTDMLRRLILVGQTTMAAWHLEQLRGALVKRGWSCAELSGDGYRVSAVWELRRPRDDRTLHLEFEALDDLRTLPIDESYGCTLRENGVGLYFRRQRSTELWQEEVAEFVKALEA